MLHKILPASVNESLELKNDNNWPLNYKEQTDSDGSISLKNDNQYPRFTLYTKAPVAGKFNECSLMTFESYHFKYSYFKGDYFRRLLTQSIGFEAEDSAEVLRDGTQFHSSLGPYVRALADAAAYSPGNWLGNLINPSYTVPNNIIDIVKKYSAGARLTLNNTEDLLALADFTVGHSAIFGETENKSNDPIDVALHVIKYARELHANIHKVDILKNKHLLTSLIDLVYEKINYKFHVYFGANSNEIKQGWENIFTLIEMGANPATTFRKFGLPTHIFQKIIPKFNHLDEKIRNRLLTLMIVNGDSTELVVEKFRALAKANWGFNISTKFGSFIHIIIVYEFNYLPEILQVMKEEKVDFDFTIRDYRERTPLILAALMRNYNAVKAILMSPYDIDVNAQDDTGRTALHYAMALGQPEMVNLLKSYRASRNINDHYHLTPLAYASVITQKEIAELLAYVCIHPFRDENAKSNAIEIAEELYTTHRVSNDMMLLNTKKNYHNQFNNINGALDRFVESFPGVSIAGAIISCQKYLLNNPIMTVQTQKVNSLKIRLEPYLADPARVKLVKAGIKKNYKNLTGKTVLEACWENCQQLLNKLAGTTKSHSQANIKVCASLGRLRAGYALQPVLTQSKQGLFYISKHKADELKARSYGMNEQENMTNEQEIRKQIFRVTK